MASVLIIDDDVELCAMLRDYLEPNGFQIDILHQGRAGFDAIRKEKYAILILDVMLPDVDGFEVLRSLRSWSDIGVVLLSARGSDADRIVGLEIGADDYLPKPFNPRELLARMSAILRRGSSGFKTLALATMSSTAGSETITIDHRARRVWYKTEPLDLTQIEYSLMEAFIESPGAILDREELVQRVFGRTFHPLDRSLDMNVSRLRKKLSSVHGLGDRIKTVRSMGYSFVA